MLTHAVPAFPHARQSLFRYPSRYPRTPAFTSPSSPRHLSYTRTMSAKKEFLCILPDKPGAQAKRLELRP